MSGYNIVFYTHTMATQSQPQPPKFKFRSRVPEKTSDTYKLYVDDAFYLQDKADINGTNLSLTGKYMGSGTRIHEIGTVFFSAGYRQYNEPVGKQIKIMCNDTTLFDFNVTAEKFMEHADDMNFSVVIDNGVTIYLRDLHRFDGYPYEISGVKFPTPQ